jgi:hypothetical protein
MQRVGATHSAVGNTTVANAEQNNPKACEGRYRCGLVNACSACVAYKEYSQTTHQLRRA